MQTNISVRRITVAELGSFVSNPDYLNLESIPISRHRARSYQANPRCKPTDTVLYMAMLGDRMVGYRTVMPDQIFDGNKPARVAWLSGNWVSPDSRRQGISSDLLGFVLKDYDGRLLFTNYAPESKAVYDKSGAFRTVFTLTGARLYLRPCLKQILTPRSKFLAKLRVLWAGIDTLLGFLNPLPLLLRMQSAGKGLSFEYLSHPDQEVAALFQNATRDTATQRGKEELEWILGNPWVVSSPLGDALAQKYAFSSGSRRFESHLVKVYKERKLRGFLLLNLKDEHLSTPYIVCQHDDAPLFARIILMHGIKLNAKRITVYHQEVAKHIKGIFPLNLFTIKQARNFIATHSVATLLSSGNCQFLEGDGDCAFV